MEKIIRFIKDEEGMELSEYAVVGGLLLIIAAGVIITWGGELNRVFGLIVGVLQGVGGGGGT
jgi:Flp pilus assembly pilin Flp